MSAAWTVAGVRWAVAGVLGPPVVSPCRATGVINGAPTFGVVATGGWPQVVDAGRVVAGCWVRLWFRPAGLSWCRRVVGAPFMTPVAARRRQDVGRTDSREVLGPPMVSPCRVILVSACRRGAIYDARCRPQAARCRPHGLSRGVRFACGFALSGDGRHKWRPYVWCGGDGWLAAGGGCWVGRRGRVGFACGFALPGYLGVGVS